MKPPRHLGRTMVALFSSAVFLATVVAVSGVEAADEATITIDSTERSFGNLNELLDVSHGTSGVVYSRQNDGVLWALTDRRLKTDGGKQTLFAIDPATWRLISAYTVTGSGGNPYNWTDFEDITVGPGGPTGWYLYLYEDVGNDHHILRIAEPSISINQPTNRNATIAVDKKANLTFPDGTGPEIESLAIDQTTDTALLVERRRENNSCARTTDNTPNRTWRIDSFLSSFDASDNLALVAVTGMVARPSGVGATTQNLVGAGDISADGFVLGVSSVPRAGSCNRDAYVTLRTRRPGESWGDAIARQVQLSNNDPQATRSFTAEAFALAPDMSHLVYAPEWGGYRGQLYYKTLTYVAPTTSTDTEPPTASIAFGEGSDVGGDPALLSGEAADNVAVSAVAVSVANSTGQWLQADDTFDAVRAYLPALLGSPGASPTTWQYSTTLPPDDYSLSVRTTDTSDNASEVTAHGFVVPAPVSTSSVVLSAGDIADCTSPGDELTADLLAAITAAEPVAAIATLGDTAYPDGTAADFANCWDPTWGPFDSLIYPAVGNHEYHTPGATGYFDHFGARAGDPTQGYYSYDIDENWHAIVLNSECGHVAGGGCVAGSEQVEWLYSDLEANRDKNVLAYWHRPRFAKNNYNDDTTYQPFWQALSDYDAELVLVGHEHHYERYQPLDADGVPSVNGIRQFIVGSGGVGMRGQQQAPSPFSETRNHDDWGILKLVLEESSYSWEFVPAAGGVYADSGVSPVNDPTTPPPTGDIELIAAGSDWKYDDSGDDLGTAWKDASYDDTNWSSGPAELGYGDGGETTVTNRNGLTTYFRRTFDVDDASLVTALRTRIVRDDGYVIYINGVEAVRENMPAGIINRSTTASSGVWGSGEGAWIPFGLGPSLLVDGTNVIAVEMHQVSSGSSDISFDLSLEATFPTTPPPPDTEAPSMTVDFAAGASLSGPEVALSGTAADNQEVSAVAVSVKNADGQWLQDDGSFAPTQAHLDAALSNPGGTLTNWTYPEVMADGDYQLFAVVTDGSANAAAVDDHDFSVITPSFTPLLIDRGAVWKYNDSGNDLGTAWRASSYDDDTWFSGPAELGFGDNDEVTRTQKNGITTYFRKSFNLADASAINQLSLEIVRDDGAVIYLNGVEVYRTNMPTGTIHFDTGAGHVNGNAERQWHAASIDSSLLVDGLNVVAVEVHNNSPASSDISFNFYLEANQ